jgi:hypothetical protein
MKGPVYSDMFLEGPMSTTKNVNHSRPCPDQNFYLGLPEYKPGLPPTDYDLRSRYYILFNWYRNYLVINLFLSCVKFHNSLLRLFARHRLIHEDGGQNNSAKTYETCFSHFLLVLPLQSFPRFTKFHVYLISLQYRHASLRAKDITY